MARFYDASEEERIEYTLEAIANQRTILDRWAALAEEESGGWDSRASLAATLLAGEKGVLDLGCGLMTLRRYLDVGVTYWPCDVVARDAQTLVCDLNREDPPIVAATAVAVLGVLEYLFYPEKLLENLSRSYNVAVVSYCIVDAPYPLEPRRAHAWVNDFDRAEIEAIFAANGWDAVAFEIHNGLQGVWRLRSRISN